MKRKWFKIRSLIWNKTLFKYDLGGFKIKITENHIIIKSKSSNFMLKMSNTTYTWGYLLTSANQKLDVASSDAVAVFVEGNARNYNQVVVAVIRFVLRFKDVEVANGKVGIFRKFYGNDVVADNGRKYDFLFVTPSFQEVMRVDFVRKRAVEHDSLCFNKRFMIF